MSSQIISDQELRELYSNMEKSSLVETCIRYFRQVEKIKDTVGARAKVCHVQSETFTPRCIRVDRDCESCEKYY